MEMIYTLIIEAVNAVRVWFSTHQKLGGEVVAPICIVVFMCIGFIFLFKSLSSL